MTKEQIDMVLERIRSWPPERQEDAVQLLLTMEAQGSEPYRLSDEERDDIDTALEELARGEIASDTEVANFFNRHRR